MDGWIKYYRQSIDNPLFKKPLVWHYWQYCLLKANHKPHKIIWNKKEMIIDKGSFVTGLKQSAKETGLSIRNIRTARKIFLNLKMIEISTPLSTPHYTYLTICNYEKYQLLKNLSDTPSDRAATGQRQGSDNKQEVNNNEKNEKNIKKKERQYKVYVHDESFEKFYKVYPKKKNRADAEKAWTQLFHLSTSEYYIGPLTDELLETIIQSIPNQKAEKKWKTEAQVFCPVWPYPATWLRGKRWQDEIEEEEVKINPFLPEKYKDYK